MYGSADHEINVHFQKKSIPTLMEGHGKFLGGAGILKVKIFEAKYEAKLEFPGGMGGGCTTKNLL